MEKKKFEHCWRFHKTKPAQLVKSLAHLKSLGAGWEDSPAKHGVITHPLSPEQQAMADGKMDESDFYEDEEEEEAPKKGKQKG